MDTEPLFVYCLSGRAGRSVNPSLHYGTQQQSVAQLQLHPQPQPQLFPQPQPQPQLFPQPQPQPQLFPQLQPLFQPLFQPPKQPFPPPQQQHSRTTMIMSQRQEFSPPLLKHIVLTSPFGFVLSYAPDRQKVAWTFQILFVLFFAPSDACPFASASCLPFRVSFQRPGRKEVYYG